MTPATSGYVVVNDAKGVVRVLDKLESVRESHQITWQQVVPMGPSCWWVFFSTRYGIQAIDRILVGDGARPT